MSCKACEEIKTIPRNTKDHLAFQNADYQRGKVDGHNECVVYVNHIITSHQSPDKPSEFDHIVDANKKPEPTELAKAIVELLSNWQRENPVEIIDGCYFYCPDVDKFNDFNKINALLASRSLDIEGLMAVLIHTLGLDGAEEILEIQDIITKYAQPCKCEELTAELEKARQNYSEARIENGKLCQRLITLSGGSGEDSEAIARAKENNPNKKGGPPTP